MLHVRKKAESWRGLSNQLSNSHEPGVSSDLGLTSRSAAVSDQSKNNKEGLELHE